VSWLYLKLARHPIDVLLAERTNDKENQETSTVINKSLNAGIGILASESFRYHWSMIIIAFQHFFEKFNTFW
jgi:hypothetical protein